MFNFNTFSQNEILILGVMIGFCLSCLFISLGSIFRLIDRKTNYILSYTIKRVIRRII